MDQEAEIMKQSIARRDAAQAAAEEAEGEEEPQQPLRTVSSAGRGVMCICLFPYCCHNVCRGFNVVYIFFNPNITSICQPRRWCSG